MADTQSNLGKLRKGGNSLGSLTFSTLGVVLIAVILGIPTVGQIHFFIGALAAMNWVRQAKARSTDILKTATLAGFLAGVFYVIIMYGIVALFELRIAHYPVKIGELARQIAPSLPIIPMIAIVFSLEGFAIGWITERINRQTSKSPDSESFPSQANDAKTTGSVIREVLSGGRAGALIGFGIMGIGEIGVYAASLALTRQAALPRTTLTVWLILLASITLAGAIGGAVSALDLSGNATGCFRFRAIGGALGGGLSSFIGVCSFVIIPVPPEIPDDTSLAIYVAGAIWAAGAAINGAIMGELLGGIGKEIGGTRGRAIGVALSAVSGLVTLALIFVIPVILRLLQGGQFRM